MQRETFMELDKSWEGYSPVSVKRPPDWSRRLARFIPLIENHNKLPSFVHKGRLQEAMGIPDFPTLFGDVLNREMLADFQALPNQMRQLTQVKPINDFETIRRSKGEGLIQTFPKVPVSGEYKHRVKSVNHYTYSLDKFGALVGLTWEAWLRDVDDFFGTIVPDLAKSAMNTEERLITELFMGSGGPLTAFFADATRGQTAVSTLPLTTANLQTAITEMTGSIAGYRIKSEPVLNVPKFLMVPTALWMTAEEILRATLYGQRGNATTTTAEGTIADRNITLIVNPWCDIINTTNGATAWYLFSDTVKAAEFGFLKGAPGPELFMKHPDAMRIGGGDVSPFDGSYLHDDIGFKVRLSIGGMTLDPIGGWASKGV